MKSLIEFLGKLKDVKLISNTCYNIKNEAEVRKQKDENCERLTLEVESCFKRIRELEKQNKEKHDENRLLKDKIKDLEREWKGSSSVSLNVRKERRQSIHDANRLLPSCSDCNELKENYKKLENEVIMKNVKIVEYQSKISKLDEKLADNMDEKSVNYYKSACEELERKLKKLVVHKQFKDQGIQVQPIDLSMHLYSEERVSILLVF